jgi:hypothetical protein
VNLWEEAYVDSVGVVELIVHLERRWEVELPDEVVFDPEFASVNGIARLVRRLRASPAARAASPARDASLVLLQARGEGAPLFLVHAGDGLALPYANLARRLAGTRPVYALQLLAADGLPMVHTRVEEMAAHYVPAVRGVQPRGPYLLGGSCLGALVASEMAQILETEREEVRLVLLDAADPSAARRPNLEMRRRVGRASHLVRSTTPLRLPAALARKLLGFAAFEWQRLRRGTSARLGLLAIRLCRRLRLPPPRWVREMPVRALCMLAIERYRASHMLRAAIVLFCGTVGIGEDEPLAQVLRRSEARLAGAQRAAVASHRRGRRAREHAAGAARRRPRRGAARGAGRRSGNRRAGSRRAAARRRGSLRGAVAAARLSGGRGFAGTGGCPRMSLPRCRPTRDAPPAPGCPSSSRASRSRARHRRRRSSRRRSRALTPSCRASSSCATDAAARCSPSTRCSTRPRRPTSSSSASRTPTRRPTASSSPFTRACSRAAAARSSSALEMFERDAQPALDDYLAGRIDEATFLAASRPWRNYATSYRPLVEAARRAGAPVVASNVPRPLRQRIDSEGDATLAGLAPDERALAPAELLPNTPLYWKRADNAIRGHRAMMPPAAAPGAADAPASPASPEEDAHSAARLTSSQSLWDNTMGESCAQALERHPGYAVCHVNGGFHSQYWTARCGSFACARRTRASRRSRSSPWRARTRPRSPARLRPTSSSLPSAAPTTRRTARARSGCSRG